MFKLKRLEITGFKSFADYTEILFTGDGITAIVGPNGCGKSNVADAIAWVLGEQRVKHLRGGAMQDVIFQGSRNRQPSGMAEVVMHMVRDEALEHEPDIEDIDSTLEQLDDQVIDIDAGIPIAATPETPGAEAAETNGPESAFNPEVTSGDSLAADATAAIATSAKVQHKRHWRRRNLALEFAPGEAVSVTRRLYRSGESEYLLNDRPCRLRDIQDLFSGTGLAGGHYAIIEQGRIGQILSAKPMDRRTIIEEAAGITKFRVRQRAAEARLDSARSNLSRISDIISEIDRQVNSLRRQAAKARRYQVFREELRELLRHVFVAEDRKLTNLLDETQAKLLEASALERNVAEDLERQEEAARGATHEARKTEDDLAATRAAAADAVLRRDRQARERAYQEEQVVALEKRKNEVGAEIDALAERLVLVEAECKRLQEDDVRLTVEAEHSVASLRTAEESYAEKLSKASHAEAEIETARADLLKHTAVAERLREIARQLEGTLERLGVQAEGLAREGERAAAQYDERKAEADAFNHEIGIARAHILTLNAERERAVDAVVQGHEAVSDTEAELTRVRDEYSRTRHRLESLKELDDRRAYYSSAVQLMFAEDSAPRDFHFIGTLADALNVEAKWERAVEGVFGSSLQSIVVPTPDDAARAAQWLRENNGGRASFLVAGLHGGSEESSTQMNALACEIEERPALSISFAGETIADNLKISDLLGAPRELLSVLQRTLPGKMNARLAANLDEAMTRSLQTGEVFVTLNGDWVASGQFVSAGDARALEEGAGLLTFKRELRELEARAEVLSAESKLAEESSGKARASLVGLEDAVLILNEAIGREEREAMAREVTATGFAHEIERAERHMRVVAEDAARVEQERIEVERRRATAIVDAEESEASRLAATEMVTAATFRLAEARRSAESESEGLGGQRAAAAAATERRRGTAAELRRMEAEFADLASRVERHRFELLEMTERIGALGESIAELEYQASTVAAEKAKEEQEIASLTARLDEARRQADALAVQLSDLNKHAAEVRDARAGIEVQRAEAQARLTFVRENCAAELGQSLEDLAREQAIDDEFDLETAQRRVEELRTRIEGFGGVNMMALEELAENEARLLFLTVQRQDIVDSISSTEEALREIKRRSRERFRHAFEQINKNFSELFQELFGGGKGEMSLIEGDDVLEAGIDVIAQPPGKRLQNVLLLSGGEKAMAALALVLGIFHYRPSPFCLLDEVDAPLDEANVGRFTDKVAQMSANTQFIVITHNKRTMEMARALYGVTMQEVGVSKLVSVRFE
ncbi:MAG TPA: chromosome segregation protein SMC [Pyrinomonadaceae bacterium]|nr:chromosome segregation protein SMC [Pyrinomonadaceae bacterium]